jgi:hypothetical protein
MPGAGQPEENESLLRQSAPRQAVATGSAKTRLKAGGGGRGEAAQLYLTEQP